MTMTESKDRSNRDRTYSITELCREFDVTPRTLRFHEQKGLLHPARRGWTRLFSYRDRARLQLILRGKKVGFALEEIKEMLDLYNLRDGQLTQLRIASTKMRERLEALRKQRVELEDAAVVNPQSLPDRVTPLDGGIKHRDPRFIARRLIISASEDIGLADPRSLEIAMRAAEVYERQLNGR